jgi:hypothetical protein
MTLSTPLPKAQQNEDAGPGRSKVLQRFDQVWILKVQLTPSTEYITSQSFSFTAGVHLI